MKYQALIYVGPFRLRFLCLFFTTDILNLNTILPSWSFWPFYSPCDYIITSVTQNDVIRIFHICIYGSFHFLSLFSTDTDFLIKPIFFFFNIYLYRLCVSGWQLLFFSGECILVELLVPITVHLHCNCNSQHHLPCVLLKEWHIFPRKQQWWKLIQATFAMSFFMDNMFYEYYRSYFSTQMTGMN